MKWHCVVNEDSQILAVYGAALLSDAQEKARVLGYSGLPTWVVQVSGTRPRVGEPLKSRFKPGDRVGFKGSTHTATVIYTRPGSIGIVDNVTGEREVVSDRSSYLKKITKRR